MSNTIRLHHIMERSEVNGPDNRFVIWTQGCPLHCAGCFNEPTHALNGGYNISINSLAQKVNQTTNIRGITLTGGEPLFQAKEISQFLQLINKNLDVLLFSGYTLDEVMTDVNKKNILYQVDAVLLGRYDQSLSHPFFGKKLVLNGNRIKKEELKPWLNTEIIIKDNNVEITGLYKQSI